MGSAPGSPRSRTRPATGPTGAGSPPGRRGASWGGDRGRSPPASRPSGPGQLCRPPRLPLPGPPGACQGCAAASGSGCSGCYRCPWLAPSLERAAGEPGRTGAGVRRAGRGGGAGRGIPGELGMCDGGMWGEPRGKGGPEGWMSGRSQGGLGDGSDGGQG